MAVSPGWVTAASADLPPPKKRAGERTDAVDGSVHPTNARSAGIFKGL